MRIFELFFSLACFPSFRRIGKNCREKMRQERKDDDDDDDDRKKCDDKTHIIVVEYYL